MGTVGDMELGGGSIREASEPACDFRGKQMLYYGRALYTWRELPEGLYFVAPDYMAMPRQTLVQMPIFSQHLRKSHLGFVPWGSGETPLHLDAHMGSLEQSPALGRNDVFLRNWLWTHETLRGRQTFLQDARSLVQDGEREHAAIEFLTAAQVLEYGIEGVRRWLAETDRVLGRSRKLLARRGIKVA